MLEAFYSLQTSSDIHTFPSPLWIMMWQSWKNPSKSNYLAQLLEVSALVKLCFLSSEMLKFTLENHFHFSGTIISTIQSNIVLKSRQNAAWVRLISVWLLRIISLKFPQHFNMTFSYLTLCKISIYLFICLIYTCIWELCCIEHIGVLRFNDRIWTHLD